MELDLRLHTSLEKVFPDMLTMEGDGPEEMQLFQNETASFQASWRVSDGDERREIAWGLESPIAGCVRVRRVLSVPVGLAAFTDADEDYLRTEPGLYPDLLTENGLKNLYAYPGQRCCLWLDVEPDGLAAGEYPLTIWMGLDGRRLAERSIIIRVLPGALPPQKLIHTRWLHGDCLCEAYGVEPMSDDFFRIAENFMAAAVRRGVNAVLTPIHTPPLDTAVGGERMTVQLVRIRKRGAQYDFDFALLDRWVDTARRAGMVWFEMAHLFSQWGAKAAPKIVATVDGEEKRIFGWDTPADSAEYRAFLAQYLTALCAHLRALGVADRCFFHISDEPSSDHLDLYRSARESVEPYVKGFAIVDALSDYSFYQTGAVTTPVVATNHIQPFIDAGVPGLWCYYCVSQNRLVSNMFMAMPSARNRILGVQLYLYRIAGFLHWGYNFYHSQYSRSVINPYLVTDGDGFSPSGDPFIVYPGPGGVPEESIRLMVTAEALQDLRALTWLEQLRGREFVEQLIGADITFDRYPKGADFVLSLRRRVNEAIVAAQK